MGALRLAILVALVWMAWRYVKRRLPPDTQAKINKGTARGEAVRVVKCAFCGVHVPESDAVIDGARSFCCVEHQRRFQQGNADE